MAQTAQAHPRRYQRLQDYAESIGVHPRTCKRWVLKGFPIARIARALLVPVDAANEWIDRHVIPAHRPRPRARAASR
jgi:hypothetical protein